MLLAGHATTATGLAWLWHEAMGSPDLMVRLRAEADQVLGPERLPGLAEIRRLELAEAAFREALRRYPPIWGIGRRAIADDRLPSGTTVAAGTIINILPPVVHRRADLFPERDEFRPERFLRETRALLPAGSFIPFGIGPRSCIGEGFAMLEAGILIAMMVRQFDFEPLSEPPVTPETLIVHRPRHGVWARVRRRP
jgi:cytochrome P450